MKTSRLSLPMILALLVGCSSGTGVISGELVAVGGPANVRTPVPGTIQISGSDDHATYRIAAASNGRFTAEVPAGTYLVTGHSPLYGGGRGDCRIDPPSLTVRAGESITIAVTCDMK